VTLALEELTGWPLGGFKYTLLQDAPAPPPPRSAAMLGAAAGALIELLTSSECAHNLLLADRGATVYVLPRAHQAGGGAEDGRMAVAFAETCGIAIVYDKGVFDSFTAQEYEAALAGAAITGRIALEVAAAVAVVAVVASQVCSNGGKATVV
jgi:hypothetical protein